MLAINQLIKIIIGVVVISVVVMGLYFFGSYVADFFGNFAPGEEEKRVDSKESKIEVSSDYCNTCSDITSTGSSFCGKTECLSLGNCRFEKGDSWYKIDKCVINS
tara:strand:- start:166 stop:480 length:315 start_codon:yes stop_codon:yes gene_type:complete